jgi:FPC/CPF motif-containing protein YcgG
MPILGDPDTHAQQYLGRRTERQWPCPHGAARTGRANNVAGY